MFLYQRYPRYISLFIFFNCIRLALSELMINMGWCHSEIIMSSVVFYCCRWCKWFLLNVAQRGTVLPRQTTAGFCCQEDFEVSYNCLWKMIIMYGIITLELMWPRGQDVPEHGCCWLLGSDMVFTANSLTHWATVWMSESNQREQTAYCSDVMLCTTPNRKLSILWHIFTDLMHGCMSMYVVCISIPIHWRQHFVFPPSLF